MGTTSGPAGGARTPAIGDQLDRQWAAQRNVTNVQLHLERGHQVVPNYQSSRMISHEYDAQVVRTEGLKSVCALPVVGDGEVFGVIYLATRDGSLGDRTLRQAAGFVRHLGRDLHTLSSGRKGGFRVRSPSEAVAVLDDVIDGLQDSLTRGRLSAVRQHLAAELTVVPEGGFGLTPRELDVLRLVAQGATNLRVGDELGLREQTVKSYLHAAMRKLRVRNRTSAVRVARSAGLI